MAERVTAESVLKKISQRHLECQICMDRFKEPKMLECFHSFCLECLRHLAETNPTLICPVCRGENLPYIEGIYELHTDFKLISLLDDVRELETELQSQQESQPPVLGSLKCSKHTDNDVIMYCDSCKQLVCTTCIAKDHRMHNVIEIKEVLDNCKKKANEILAEVRQHHKHFKIAMENIYGMSCKTLDSMFAETIAEISRKADEEIAKEVERIKKENIGKSRRLFHTMFKATKAKISKKADEKITEEVARIREEERRELAKLAKTYKEKATKIETADATNNNEMRKAQNREVIVNQLMDKVNFTENLHLIDELLQDLKDYTEIQPKQVPHELAIFGL